MISTKDTGKIYGEKFDTKIDIIPTDNRVQGINSGGAKIVGQSSSWFSFLLDVNSTNQNNNFVSPYRVMLFQNGDDSNPIWISNERLTVGKGLKFDVNLNKEEYKNIQVQIIDVNTLDKIGDPSTMNELKNGLGAGVISGIVIGSLTILAMIILVLTFIVREIWKNHYKKRKYI